MENRDLSRTTNFSPCIGRDLLCENGLFICSIDQINTTNANDSNCLISHILQSQYNMSVYLTRQQMVQQPIAFKGSVVVCSINIETE